MKIFIAGATGAIGKRLVPLLVSAGHQVIGMIRNQAHAGTLRAAGAEPVIADALDREAVRAAVLDAQPAAVVHELTALSKMRDVKHFDDEFAMTNRLRTQGVEYLLAAAQESGALRFVAQSYSGWPNERSGSRVKTEEDPLDPQPPKAMRQSTAAIRHLEQMVACADGLTGIVLRYGSLYGPATSLGEGGYFLEIVRQRKFPIVGDGAGVWSFIHVDDAASATRLAIEHGPHGVYNIVDDEPAELAAWLPALATAVGAKPPLHIPAWIGRFAVGEAGVSLMTKVRGSSNAKAKRVLAWRPVYASWREGFYSGLATQAAGAAVSHAV